MTPADMTSSKNRHFVSRRFVTPADYSQLREAFARFPQLSRMLGTVPALEIVKEDLADPIGHLLPTLLPPQTRCLNVCLSFFRCDGHIFGIEPAMHGLSRNAELPSCCRDISERLQGRWRPAWRPRQSILNAALTPLRARVDAFERVATDLATIAEA